MRTQDTAQFDALARDTAATVRATVRRWWLDSKDRHILHVEAERAFVGARPVIVHFTVPLGKTRKAGPAKQPKMEVGVPVVPTRTKARTPRRKVRPSGQKARSTPRKMRAISRKARPVRASEPPRQPRRAGRKQAASAGKKARRSSPRR